jgi:hypothetical protein
MERDRPVVTVYDKRGIIRWVTSFSTFLSNVDPMKIIDRTESHPLSTWSGNIIFRGSGDCDKDGVLYNDVQVDFKFSDDDVLTFENHGDYIELVGIELHGKPLPINNR